MPLVYLLTLTALPPAAGEPLVSTGIGHSPPLCSSDGEGLKAQCELMDEMLQDLASLFSHQSEGGSERVGRMALQLAVGAVKEQANTLKSDVSALTLLLVSTFSLAPSGNGGSGIYCTDGPLPVTRCTCRGCSTW